MSFSPKQKEVLKIAKEKGFITYVDLNCVFSSPIARKSNLERFIALGILKLNPIGNSFQLNKDILKEIEDKEND